MGIRRVRSRFSVMRGPVILTTVYMLTFLTPTTEIESVWFMVTQGNPRSRCHSISTIAN